MVWRIQAKNLFLTYPQCDLGHELLLQALRTILGPGPSIRLARELHEDGRPHYHAFIQCKEKFSTRNERFFDYGGFHPNVQAARDPKYVFDYVSKSGDFLDSGEFTFDTNKTWAEAVCLTTAEDFKAYIKQSFPRDYVLFNERIEAYAQTTFGLRRGIYVPKEDETFGGADPAMQRWIDQRLTEGNLRVAHATPLPRSPGAAIIILILLR